MPQIAETCGCGAALALSGQYWSDLYIAQGKFQAAHAPCRAKKVDGDVDLPTAPCPWCHRHFTAATWGDHYNNRHEAAGRPFVPFDVIERWYYSTDEMVMALTLSEIVDLYVTGSLTPQKQEAGDAVARKPKRRASARAPKQSTSPRRTSTGGREPQ